DEARPAGRITERLLAALRECSFCIADLTGSNPNVMWETGYAMALGKPVIVITQDLATLPFDMKDMQALCYDRTHLNSSLGGLSVILCATLSRSLVRLLRLHRRPQRSRLESPSG